MQHVTLYLLGVQLMLLAPLGAQPPADKLSIVVIEGQGALNNIRQRMGSELVIRIDDDRNNPVPGAAVTFTLPAQGAGGTFANGSNTTTVITDNQGMAAVRGLRPNNIAGTLQIRVNASHNGQTTRSDITQFNMLVEPGSQKSRRGKIIAILAIAGGAAAGGVYAGLQKNGSPQTVSTPAPIPTITITPGAGAVGPPR